jgi:hypothetical protein
LRFLESNLQPQEPGPTWIGLVSNGCLLEGIREKSLSRCLRANSPGAYYWSPNTHRLLDFAQSQVKLFCSRFVLFCRSKEGNGSMNDLTALIRRGQAERSNDLFSMMEAKYVKCEWKGKGRSREQEPTEEEFQAAQQRVLHGGAKKPKKHRATRVAP